MKTVVQENRSNERENLKLGDEDTEETVGNMIYSYIHGKGYLQKLDRTWVSLFLFDLSKNPKYRTPYLGRLER